MRFNRSLFLLCLLFSSLVNAKELEKPKEIKTPSYEAKAQHLINNNWTTAQSYHAYSDLEIALYLETFLELWEKEDKFPQNDVAIKEAINRIQINWQSEIFTFPPERKDITRLLGVVYPVVSPNTIIMYVSEANNDTKQRVSLGQTALGHELIHVIYFATKGESEVDHLHGPKNQEWPKEYLTFLDKVNQEYEIRLDSLSE